MIVVISMILELTVAFVHLLSEKTGNPVLKLRMFFNIFSMVLLSLGQLMKTQ